MPEKPSYQDLEKRIEIQEKEINTLLKTNDKYLHIINSMSEAYSEVDLRGNFTFFNDAVPKFHGRTREEMMAMPYREYQTPEQRKRIFKIYNRIFRTGVSEEIKDFGIIKKDGTVGTTEATVSLMRDDSGEPIGFSCFRRDVEEKKTAQDALQEKEETYRMILATAPDAIIITRRSDGKYLEVNEAFYRQTGYSVEEVVGRTALELNLYADSADRERIVEGMRKHGQVDGEQVTFRAKDGTLLHDLVSFRIIRFRGEECVLIVATVITPLIETQNALKESEERYRKILEVAPDTIVIRRLKDNTYVEVNDAFCQRSGYSREEAIDRTPEDLNSYVIPGDRERLVEVLRKNNGRVDGFETRYRNRYGVIRDLLVSARIIQYRGEECVLAISKNITDLKNAHTALQKSEERYRNILETMEEGYYEVDLAGNITFFNDSMIRIYGYPPDEMMGINNRTFMAPEGSKRVFAIFNEVYRTGVPSKLVEHEIIRKDGDRRFIELSASLIRNASEEPIGFRGIVRDITERKKVENALQESEEKYRSILDTMEEGYYEVDLNGNITFCNNAHIRIYGYPLEELIGLNFRDITFTEEAKRVFAAFNEVYRTGIPSRSIDYEFKRKDGSKIIIETSASLIRNESGEPIGFRGVTRDITERKQSEIALQESEEKYRKILETMEEGYYEVDLRGSFTFANQAECRMHQLTPDEMLGLNNQKFTNPEMAKRIYKIYNQVYRTGVPAKIIDYEIIRKDGSVVTLETSASLMRDQEGNPIGFYGISRNITEKRQAEKALQESEEKYRNILETMEDGYFETDLTGNFTFLNSAMCKTYGYSHDELMGMNNREYTSAKEAKRIYGIYNQIYKTGNPANIFDQEVTCKDGSKRILETSASLLKNASGEPIGFRGITRNVTERKKAEKELENYRENLERMVRERTRELEAAQEELVKKEKLAVLGQLTATVSHELRNPLGVIRSSNFYLHRKVKEHHPKIEKHFKRIEEQVGICDAIVADLLEYTRGRHSEIVRTDLNSWLEPLLDEIFEKEKVTFKKDLTSPSLVPHDQEKIRRVIINVTDNALQAVKFRKEARKDKKKPYHPEIFIGTRTENGGVIIEIRDNGTGMDRETREHAFEPLFTTRARGTGLGLANVDKIVREHEGKITIESEPNQGTNVAIFLPDKKI